MIVNMQALAYAAVHAFFFGVGIWMLYVICLFFLWVMFGKAHEEVFHALYLPAITFFAMLFFYVVNHGVVRWFLIFTILAAFFLCQRYLFSRSRYIIFFVALWLRSVLKRAFLFITFPLRYILCKSGLLIALICGKIHIVIYHHRRRRCVGKTVLKDLSFLFHRAKDETT